MIIDYTDQFLPLETFDPKELLRSFDQSLEDRNFRDHTYQKPRNEISGTPSSRLYNLQPGHFCFLRKQELPVLAWARRQPDRRFSYRKYGPGHYLIKRIK